MEKEPIIEIFATISAIYPVELSRFGTFEQKILVDNATTINTVLPVDSRILVVVRYSKKEDVISFEVNKPITVRGNYTSASTAIKMIHHTHAPLGYIRYSGKVYR